MKTENRFKALREEHGVSQKELAARIGISATALSKIACGKTRLNEEHVSKIAEALGETQTKVLLGYEPRPESEQELHEISFLEERLRELREEKDREIAALQKKLDAALERIDELKDSIKLLKQINGMQSKQLREKRK